VFSPKALLEIFWSKFDNSTNCAKNPFVEVHFPLDITYRSMNDCQLIFAIPLLWGFSSTNKPFQFKPD
jgi:hypothetical protein